MPTSLDTAWTLTVGDVIKSAAMELGVIGIGDVLETAEETEMMKRLSGMLAKWSLDANQWREATATITLTAATGSGTLPTTVRDIRSVRHVVSATNKRPLQYWNRDQFYALPNRAQAGASPVAYYYSQQTDGDLIYVWPVPATDQDFEIDYSRGFYLTGATTQTIDLPREWNEAAIYGLASRCANMFGATRIDPGAVQRCDAQAKSEYDRMLDSDRPDSYTFEYEGSRA